MIEPRFNYQYQLFESTTRASKYLLKDLFKSLSIYLTYSVDILSIPTRPVQSVTMNGTKIDKQTIMPSNAIPFFGYFIKK